MHTFLRPIAKKHSLGFKNLSLLRNTASSSLRANRSITIQLHYPRLESTAFLSYSGTPITPKDVRNENFIVLVGLAGDRLIEM
jgi:hypothetical protein